jgi:type 1 glutamine amidotransferase
MENAMTTRKLIILCALAIGLSAPACAKSAPVIDCPLRDAPYSIDSPLMDILLKPEAKAAAEKIAPNMFDKFPPRFMSTQAPSFSAILSLRTLSRITQQPADTFVPIDAALRAIPVTEADRTARCARYDGGTVKLKVPKGKVRLLLFGKMTGFRDTPSVEAAEAMFKGMAARKGWVLVASNDAGVMNAANLKQFDAVIWNNISGDVLTVKQRAAFKGYIEQGGGWIGVHGSAGDPIYFWDWYPDTLIGARFVGHPMAPQFQDAKVQIESHVSGVGKGLEPGWTMKDEWYSFATSARASGSHVIATLDESSYKQAGFGTQNLTMGDHPIAWTRCVGKGRSFYSAIGHMPETYSNANYLVMLEQGIGWAVGGGKAVCGKGK